MVSCVVVSCAHAHPVRRHAHYVHTMCTLCAHYVHTTRTLHAHYARTPSEDMLSARSCSLRIRDSTWEASSN